MSVVCLSLSENFCTNREEGRCSSDPVSLENHIAREASATPATKISTDELELLAKLEEANR